jgi:hypothetical protein
LKCNIASPDPADPFHSKDHGHEVRLAGAVVANDQQPLVIHGLIEPKLRKGRGNQLFGHLVGDDIGLKKLPGGGPRYVTPKTALDRLKSTFLVELVTEICHSVNPFSAVMKKKFCNISQTG